MKKNIFQVKGYVVLFAVILNFSWGLAVPLLKLGMAQFAVDAADTAGRMLFAGIRFTLAGLITLCVAGLKGEELRIKSLNEAGWLLLAGFINTGLHYFCFYMGVANCVGAKASIINSINSFILIFLGSLIFHEKLTRRKLFGCLLGFLGLAVANLGTRLDGGFRLCGEGMMVLSAVCFAFGCIVTRVIGRRKSAIAVTGYSLTGGGVMLLLGAILMGSRGYGQVTPPGAGIMVLLIAISSVAFILYNSLLCNNPVGEIAIFNVLNPVFGTLSSCMLLGEAFRVKYLFALALIGCGIWAVNTTARAKAPQ